MRLRIPTVITLTLLTLASLTACTDSAAPNPSPSATSPSATPTTSVSLAPGVIPGDTAIATKQYITDAAGRYETVELAPDALPLKPTSWSGIDAAAKKAYSSAEISSGVKFAFSFAVSEGLDSIALDGNDRGWATWQKEVAPKYISATTRTAILAAPATGSSHVDRSLLIYNDQDNVFPTLVRDGKPRFSEITYEPKSAEISAGKDGKVQFLAVTAVINAKARATNAQIKEAVLALNKDAGTTSAQFDKAYPRYKNPKGISPVTIRYAFAYYLVQDDAGAWQIGGYQVKPDYGVLGQDLTTS